MSGFGRSKASGRLEPPALRRIVGNKKMLDLLERLPTERLQLPNARRVYRCLRYGNQPVVTDGLALGTLPGGENAYQPHRDQTTRKGGRITQHQDIQRVTVFGAGLWNRAKIIGKRMAGRQYPGEPETSQLLIEFELVTASARRVDYYIDQPGAGVAWRQSCQDIFHADARRMTLVSDITSSKVTIPSPC